jgi:hypothetical protein
MENKIPCILFILFLVFLCLFSGCATTPGTLDIVSSPPEAPVYLDNQYRGITPLTLSGVSPGKHTIEIRLNGFDIWSTSGTLDDGGYVRVEAALVPVSLPEPETTNPPVTPPSSDYPASGSRGSRG